MMRPSKYAASGVLLALLIAAPVTAQAPITFDLGGTSALRSGGGVYPAGLATVPDGNPDPDIVEVTLRAGVHRVRFNRNLPETEVWAYNGEVPGPTIQAEVGNTLIVHFYNDLPEPTTIHWHGVELPASMDGTLLSQRPVEPGGYFRYEFALNRASLFWYHPHFSTNEQIEKGLQGALLVLDPEADRALGLPERQAVLVLDDVLLDEAFQLHPPFPDDPLENAAMQLNGREGNMLLVNGKHTPQASVRQGVPIRLRVVNSANSRFMRISLDGHRMWRIGGDAGLLEAPIEILPVEGEGDLDPAHGLILTPGERADLIVTPMTTGPVALRWHDWARGRHSTFYMDNAAIGIGDAEDDGIRPSQVLGTLMVTPASQGATVQEYLPPSALRDIEPIDVSDARMLMAMLGHSPANADGDVTFFVQMKNGAPLPFPMVTPNDAPTVEVGETVIWDVVNMTGGEHNFHLHGFMFQPLQVTYIDMDTPANNRTEPFLFLEEKDTVRLPARPGNMGRSRSVTRLAVRFDDSGREGDIVASGGAAAVESGDSGGWMFHCHINEHSTRGMMSYVQVVEDLDSEAGVLVANEPLMIHASTAEEALEQNVPNPFSDRTTIRFALPEAETVSLRVFDLLGREVATLLEGPQEAGVHEVRWDAYGLSSGVYVYRLEAGPFVEAKRLVLRR